MSDLVFRRINGRIIPIKRSSLKIKKDDYKGASQIGAGAAISAASGIYAAKAIRKANFFYGRSANLRGASKLAQAGSRIRSSLIKQSAISKLAGKAFAKKGFGALLAGTTLAAGLATVGTSKLLKNRTSDEKKLATAGLVGSVASGVGFAMFGRRTKISSLAKLIKVANPKATVSSAFSMYSSQGAKKTMNTIRKFSSSTFSFGKGVKRQNYKAAQSVYNPNAFRTVKKVRHLKYDPNQGSFF